MCSFTQYFAQARVSKLSWMELYPLRVETPDNPDIDLTMEMAAAEKKRLIDWCENMPNLDITDYVDTCEKDLCNAASSLMTTTTTMRTTMRTMMMMGSGAGLWAWFTATVCVFTGKTLVVTFFATLMILANGGQIL